MAFQMVDSDERLVQGVSNALGGIETDEQGADQPGTDSDGYQIDITKLRPCFIDGLVDYAMNAFDMQATSEFRNYAAIAGM